MEFDIVIEELEEAFSYSGGNAERGKETGCIIEFSKGSMRFKEEALRPGLSIFEASYFMEEDVFLTGSGKEPVLEMHFNLSTHRIFQSSGKTVSPFSGNITYLAGDDENGKLGFSQQIDYRTFDVHFTPSLLEQYAGESDQLDRFLAAICEGATARYAAEGIDVSPKIFQAIHDMRHCLYDGLMRKVYLESKIYELFAFCIAGSQERPFSGRLTSYDQEQVRLAAHLIRENIDRPLTISELSKCVGINQTKLKQGFKLVFGTTVFGYLQAIRMELAKRLLLDTDLTIDQISYRVGYSNLPNFSTAFKRVFGYSPRALRIGGKP